MNYLERIQKEITLPSGYRCTVRRQTQLEAIEIGSAPGFFLRNLKLQERGQEPPDETEAEREAMLKFFARQNRVILTRCVVGGVLQSEIGNPKSAVLISDQGPDAVHPADGGPPRLSWALLDSADVDAIISASNELSGFTPAGREAAKTFPEKPADARDNGHPGAPLRLSADRPAQPLADAI